MTKYMIQEMAGLFGFWSNEKDGFKGYSFAKAFNSKNEAEKVILTLVDRPVKIIKVYNY